MKRVQKFSLLLACAILSVMTFLSCGLGDKTDPQLDVKNSMAQISC